MALRKNNQKDYAKFSRTDSDVLGNKKPIDPPRPAPGDTVRVYPNQELPEEVLPMRTAANLFGPSTPMPGRTATKYEPEDGSNARYMEIDTTGVPINKKSGMVEEFGGWDTDEKGNLRDPKGGLYFVKGENVIKKGRKKP